MSAHDDYLDPDLAGLNDVFADNEHIKAAFHDYDGPGELYRVTYKYTACGPSVGLCIRYWETVEPDGFNDYSTDAERTRWIYCEELYRLGTWADMDARGELIVAVSVSSIVEGVDFGTDNIEVPALHEELEDLMTDADEGETSKTLRRLFYAAVRETNDEANSIWQSTHGCETCAKHWHSEGITEGEWGPIEGCDGVTQIWKDCPDCGGNGVVI